MSRETHEDLPLFKLHHKHDPETSREAIESIAKTLTQKQIIVTQIFEKAGAKGLADFELAALFPLSGYSTWRTRRGELVKQGVLADSGRRKSRGPHDTRRHVVWVLKRYAEEHA